MVKGTGVQKSLPLPNTGKSGDPDKGENLYGRRSAGDLYRGASHVAGVIGGQQNINRSQLGRLTRPPQRDVFPKRFHLFHRHRGGDERSPDRAWGDTIHADPFFRQQLRQVGREILNSPFCGGVGQQNRLRVVGVHGGGVDNGAARLHVRHGCFHQIKHGVDVGAKRVVPFLARNFLQ